MLIVKERKIEAGEFYFKILDGNKTHELRGTAAPLSESQIRNGYVLYPGKLTLLTPSVNFLSNEFYENDLIQQAFYELNHEVRLTRRSNWIMLERKDVMCEFGFDRVKAEKAYLDGIATFVTMTTTDGYWRYFYRSELLGPTQKPIKTDLINITHQGLQYPAFEQNGKTYVMMHYPEHKLVLAMSSDLDIPLSISNTMWHHGLERAKQLVPDAEVTGLIGTGIYYYE